MCHRIGHEYLKPNYLPVIKKNPTCLLMRQNRICMIIYHNNFVVIFTMLWTIRLRLSVLVYVTGCVFSMLSQ